MAQVITNAELTQAITDGTGTFDVLMQAAKGHLEQEYNTGRIQGAQYAQVYLGSLTAVMQNATQFLLGQLNADKNALLIDAQIAKTDAEKLLVDKQVEKVTADIALIVQQEANLLAEAANIPKQGALLDSQKLKVDADKLLVDAQELKIDQETANLTAQSLNIPKQGAKIDAEKALLDQKKFTEEAQIKDTVDGASVVGVVGKQKDLYQAQTDGFARDAEHKLAKLMTDVWNVQRTTDEGISPAGAGISDSEIKKVVDAAKTGIGVTPG